MNDTRVDEERRAAEVQLAHPPGPRKALAEVPRCCRFLYLHGLSSRPPSRRCGPPRRGRLRTLDKLIQRLSESWEVPPIWPAQRTGPH
jgi:hypothetical protein